MKYADINFSEYPFVYINVNPIDPTLQQQGSFLMELEQVFAMNGKAILFVNTKHQKLNSSEVRIQAGQWIKKNEVNIKEKILALVFVESSIWVQMALKAVLLISKPPIPMHTAKDLEAAKELVAKEYNLK